MAEERVERIYNGYDNRCVCCGEIIPEGRQVCPRCESLPLTYNPKKAKK